MVRPGLSLPILLSLLFLLTSFAQIGDSQRPGSRQRRIRSGDLPQNAIKKTAPKGEFAFARLVYEGGWGTNNWTTDAPKADVTFVAGLKRLTNIHVTSTPFFIPLTSEEIFKYPFLASVALAIHKAASEKCTFSVRI